MTSDIFQEKDQLGYSSDIFETECTKAVFWRISGYEKRSCEADSQTDYLN
jgi:hypothetical protein